MKRFLPFLAFLALIALAGGRLGLFVFLAAAAGVLYSVSKALTGRRTGKGAVSDWKQKLKGALEQIRREMEQRRPGDEKQTGWEILMPDEEPEGAAPTAPAPPPAGDAPPPSPPPSRPGAERGAAARSTPPTRRERLGEGPPVPEAAPARNIQPAEAGLPEPGYGRPGPADLRRAVIWSEILAPPMSMREPPWP
jgi:hypothetical protein